MRQRIFAIFGPTGASRKSESLFYARKPPQQSHFSGIRLPGKRPTQPQIRLEKSNPYCMGPRTSKYASQTNLMVA